MSCRDPRAPLPDAASRPPAQLDGRATAADARPSPHGADDSAQQASELHPGRGIGAIGSHAVAMGLAVMLVASLGAVINPFGSAASGGDPPGAGPIDPASTAGPSPREPGYRSVGELAGRDHTLTLFVGPGPARYSVRSAGGELVADWVTAEELADRFPHLDPRPLLAGMDASAGPAMDQGSWGVDPSVSGR